MPESALTISAVRSANPGSVAEYATALFTASEAMGVSARSTASSLARIAHWTGDAGTIATEQITKDADETSRLAGEFSEAGTLYQTFSDTLSQLQRLIVNSVDDALSQGMEVAENGEVKAPSGFGGSAQGAVIQAELEARASAFTSSIQANLAQLQQDDTAMVSSVGQRFN